MPVLDQQSQLGLEWHLGLKIVGKTIPTFHCWSSFVLLNCHVLAGFHVQTHPCLLQSCLTSIFHQVHSIVGTRAQSAEDWRSSAFHQIRCGVTIPGTITTVTFKGFPERCQDLSVGHSPRVSGVALRAEVGGSYKLHFQFNFQKRCFRVFQHS